MSNARYLASRRAIKDALISLANEMSLDSIFMVQLAQRANVSRSTLYAHFDNVQDVYDEIIEEFADTLRPLNAHLHCSDCEAYPKISLPFCRALRERILIVSDSLIAETDTTARCQLFAENR